MNIDTTEGGQTEWNGGNLTNVRIHNIREQLRVCAMTNNIDTWIILLEQFNHEIYGFESTEEKEKLRTELRRLSQVINMYNITRQKGNKAIPAIIMNDLHNLYYTLDEVFNKSGLQTSLKEDAGDAF